MYTPNVPYLIVSVEGVMLLVNLQLVTASTVDGFQPVIEVAETYSGQKRFKLLVAGDHE